MSKEKKNKNKKNSSKPINKIDIPQIITNNINIFYDDKIIQEAVGNIRYHLIIKSKLNNETIKQISQITDIDELVEFLTKNWIKESFKNKEVRRVFGKRMAKKILLHEKADKRLSKKEFEDIVENISLMETDVYLKHQLDSYKLSDNYLIFPARINLNVWGKVLDAIILGAPEENILNCRQSICEKYYLPSVYCNNGRLLIEINELTTQEDVISIWKKIEKLQTEYKEQRQHIISMKKRANLEIDRIIIDLYDQGKKPKAISDKLYYKGYNNFTSKKVSERLKEIKKLTRRNIFEERF
ncbi:MAG: hypothetical protein U9M94_04410 [Patescibacteria group bacterium]|nr:hypothetical protein [Patescibacteria group bacterium]